MLSQGRGRHRRRTLPRSHVLELHACGQRLGAQRAVEALQQVLLRGSVDLVAEELIILRIVDKNNLALVKRCALGHLRL